MQKKHFLALCLLGILDGAEEMQRSTRYQIYFHDEYPTPPIGKIAETEIRSKLSDSSLLFYDKMDLEGKALVYKLLQQECRHLNSCAGLNSCAIVGSNDCAGKAKCKGSADGLFRDPNLAVKVAAKKIYAQRVQASKEISLK